MIAQMARNTSRIILWEINSSIDLTFSHKTNFCLDVEIEQSDVKGAFDTDGSLFIARANGVWHVMMQFGVFFLLSRLIFHREIIVMIISF